MASPTYETTSAYDNMGTGATQSGVHTTYSPLPISGIILQVGTTLIISTLEGLQIYIHIHLPHTCVIAFVCIYIYMIIFVNICIIYIMYIHI